MGDDSGLGVDGAVGRFGVPGRHLLHEQGEPKSEAVGILDSGAWRLPELAKLSGGATGFRRDGAVL